MKKKKLFVIIMLVLILTSTLGVAIFTNKEGKNNTTVAYQDITEIPNSHTAYLWAKSNELVQINEDKIDRYMNVYETIYLLWKYAGKPNVNENYRDISNIITSGKFGNYEELKQAINWAYSKNLLQNDNINLFASYTRLDVLVLLYILDEADYKSDYRANFSDIDNIDDARKVVINWASEKGIAEGFSNGELRPLEIATVRQTISFLYNYANSNKEETRLAYEWFKETSNIKGDNWNSEYLGDELAISEAWDMLYQYYNKPQSDTYKIVNKYYYGKYKNAAQWAYEKGLVFGNSNTEDYDLKIYGNSILREGFIRFLYTLSGNDGSEIFDTIEEFKNTQDSTFSHTLHWAKSVGIAKNYGDNTFTLGESLTKEQAIIFLYRYYQFEKRNSIE